MSGETQTYGNPNHDCLHICFPYKRRLDSCYTTDRWWHFHSQEFTGITTTWRTLDSWYNTRELGATFLRVNFDWPHALAGATHPLGWGVYYETTSLYFGQKRIFFVSPAHPDRDWFSRPKPSHSIIRIRYHFRLFSLLTPANLLCSEKWNIFSLLISFLYFYLI